MPSVLYSWCTKKKDNTEGGVTMLDKLLEIITDLSIIPLE